MKQPQKYLAAVDAPTRRKLLKALDALANLEGDIKPLAGYDGLFRCKIAHYRIIFRWVKGEIVIVVLEINSRTNIKYNHM